MKNLVFIGVFIVLSLITSISVNGGLVSGATSYSSQPLLASSSITESNISVTINSLYSNNRDGKVIPSPKVTGDNLNVGITVTDNNGIDDIRRTFLSWGKSWVDCNLVKFIQPNKIKYLCIMTVTPTINGATDVFLNISSRQENMINKLIGSYNLDGQSNAGYVNPLCKKKITCTEYKRTCIQKCTSYKRNRTCNSYSTVCSTDKPLVCINTKEVITCPSR